MFFVWKEATSRLTKWPTGEMNEMKNSYTYKPWIVDVGVDFDLVLGSMLMLKICFDVVDGNCDAYNMIMVMLCLWQFSSLSYREPILGKWGWHLGLCPLCSKKPRQALLLMTVVSRQMTSWWIIPCLVEQTAPMLVLADTLDFSRALTKVSLVTTHWPSSAPCLFYMWRATVLSLHYLFSTIVVKSTAPGRSLGAKQILMAPTASF